MVKGLTHMAHFGSKTALRTRRTLEYGSLAVLAFEPNCTHVSKPWTALRVI